jgi:hypothetical protein
MKRWRSVSGREYVVLVDGKVVADPFPTVAEAVSRGALLRKSEF